MIAEHADYRHAGTRKLPRQDVRLLWQAVIGQVAAQRDHVRVVARSREELPEPTPRVDGAVQVADRRDSGRRRGAVAVLRLAHAVPLLAGAVPESPEARGRSDRLELLEGLTAVRAVVDGPAQGGPKRILERRAPRAAVRAGHRAHHG